jgi:predicted lipoprotein
MTHLSRREFLRHTALLAAATGCNSWRTPLNPREQVLDHLVRQIAVPDARAIAVHARALADALHSEQAQPSAAGLERARAALRQSALAWQNAYAFRNGPIIESHAFLRSAFWPIRPTALRELIESGDAIEAGVIEELGVDAKGVFAIEHLLYEGPSADAPAWYAGPQGERARALAVALADDAAGYAHKAQQQLGAGDAFSKQFGRAGQQSINLLVNQMIGTLETAAARRVEHVVATHDNGTLRSKDVQGSLSGLSAAIPRAWLATTERLYAGGTRATDQAPSGLGALVRAAAPHIDVQMGRLFDTATAALQQLAAPLEQVVTRDRPALIAAVSALKALETALRVDLVSALGVTLTFVASDGD